MIMKINEVGVLINMNRSLLVDVMKGWAFSYVLLLSRI